MTTAAKDNPVRAVQTRPRGARGEQAVRSPPVPAPPLPEPLRRMGDRLPVGVLLVVLAGQLLPGGWASWGSVPVGVGFLVGLPHGAVDHLVPTWALARRLPLHVTAGLTAGYVLAAVVTLVVLHAAPDLGLLTFLALSLLHFGTGELCYQRLRVARPHTPVAPLGMQALGVLAWGGTAVLLPLCVWPARTGPILDALAPGASAVLTPGVRATVTAVVLVSAAAWAAAAVREHQLRAAGELALLVAVFLLTPPLLACAAYFGGWHSVRHLTRLIATDPANAASLSTGRLLPSLRRFGRQAAVPTLLALLTLAVLVVISQSRQTLLVSDLGLLAALTVPHMLTVAWLDRQPRAGLPRLAPLTAAGRP